MKSSCFFFLICFGFTVLIAQAQSDDHEIDVRLAKCLELNDTTFGMMECQTVATEEWDAELNKTYQLLMETLGTVQQEELRTTQRQWISYRDAEYKFSDGLYYRQEGTMWKIVAVQRRKEVVKQRALELAWYCKIQTEG